jgi:hypothetical protein
MRQTEGLLQHRCYLEKTRAGTFWYGYHRDAHTSLVGVRELTNGSYWAFENDAQVESWLAGEIDERTMASSHPGGLGLFAYPGQSNLNGRRLSKDWTRQLRENPSLRNTYTLFDAAALAMTSSQRRLSYLCLATFWTLSGPEATGA